MRHRTKSSPACTNLVNKAWCKLLLKTSKCLTHEALCSTLKAPSKYLEVQPGILIKWSPIANYNKLTKTASRNYSSSTLSYVSKHVLSNLDLQPQVSLLHSFTLIFKSNNYETTLQVEKSIFSERWELWNIIK